MNSNPLLATIPVLGIPHFNRPELLARCIASIDYPVDKLVIVQQGAYADKIYIHTGHKTIAAATILEDGVMNGVRNIRQRMDAIGEYNTSLIKEVVVIEHPNAGVAGAWNEIIKLFPAPWWLISNNDIEFAPGDLEKMAAEMDVDADLNAKLCYGNHGASWFGITTDCVLKAGLFDENLYPAYLEDCDYAYRCDLLGIKRENVPNCKSRHGDDQQAGSCTVNATPELAAQNARTHAGNFEYYKDKWGGVNGEEVFKTPFNIPGFPPRVWLFLPRHRRHQQW